eukprot:TRINITY_DN2725_c2_g1_i3.p1 TRINITY_DN2725_c2_g1~~TRINITY_DN2725_c2_g1_i3.p1  ORF type:complete len:478 (-),score=32.48 TRINITY_DN2725_c2_g1_i3:176-1588(-)
MSTSGNSSLHLFLSQISQTFFSTPLEFLGIKNQTQKHQQPPPLRSQSPLTLQSFTWDEIKKHNNDSSCWVVVHNRVYDVSEFVGVHPGGPVIRQFGGRDATDVFSAFHSKKAWEFLGSLLIGDVEDRREVSQIERDYRRLRVDMIKEGLFVSNKLYYLWKVFSNLMILGCQFIAIYQASDSWLLVFVASFLVALFWQQTGWLCHDFLHHQVFPEKRWLGTAIGYFQGNLTQGFSVEWWTRKHNTHHALPNQLDGHSNAVDPDIDTLPYLAWSKDQVNEQLTTVENFLVQRQQYFFFPILLLARFAWLQQSISYVVSNLKGRPSMLLELLQLIIYYMWWAGFSFIFLSPSKWLIYLVSSQVISGFLLSIVFVQSHNGMEVFSKRNDFPTAQVLSTRNICSTMWNDWFTGGLNYQIEHHLFPAMPRHNFSKVRARVVQLCQKNNLCYESCTFGEGTSKILKRLADVAEKIDL